MNNTEFYFEAVQTILLFLIWITLRFGR